MSGQVRKLTHCFTKPLVVFRGQISSPSAKELAKYPCQLNNLYIEPSDESKVHYTRMSSECSSISSHPGSSIPESPREPSVDLELRTRGGAYRWETQQGGH